MALVLAEKSRSGYNEYNGRSSTAAFGYGKTGETSHGLAAVAACAGTFRKRYRIAKNTAYLTTDQQTVNNIFHKKPSPSGILLIDTDNRAHTNFLSGGTGGLQGVFPIGIGTKQQEQHHN